MEKKKVISSLVYKFIERLGVKGLGLLISVVLARILTTESFGQIAIINVFINLSQVIIEGGFTTALIQRKDVTEQDYSTVFYINIALASVCFAVLQIAAPLISGYYALDITRPLQIYAITLFLNAFSALQLARMQKQMKFRKIMVCSLIATVISGAIGITAAYCGFGLWALILYNMMNSAVTCIIAALVEKWLPKFEFSLHRAKMLFSYGWKMFASAVLCSLYADVRSLVIGKKFSNNDLAYYNRGEQFPQVISHTLDSAIQSVMFPTMAEVQDDRIKLRSILRKAEVMGVYVIVPMMFGLAAVSEAVILLFLTEKWMDCVPYMRWLCLANAATPIISSNLIAIKASGRSDIYMRLEMIRRVVMMLILLIGIFGFGTAEGIAVSFCISNWLDAVISMIPAKRLMNYGICAQIGDVWKILLTAAVMFVVVQCMNLLNWPTLILLAGQIFVGIVVYVAVGAAMKLGIQTELIHLAMKTIRKKKHS